MKSLISVLISLMPINPIKIFFYRTLFGYHINYGSKIGFFNIINAKTVMLNNATIGDFNLIKGNEIVLKDDALIQKFNRVKNFNKLSLDEEAMIYSWNFISGLPKGSSIPNHSFKQQNLLVGKTSSILRKNYFDLVNEISIGDNVVFGGNGSEFWTHGFDTKRTMLFDKISFENNIFVGSNCIFTKGVHVVSETTITPGSIVYKSILEPGIYSTHQLRKVK